MNISLIKEAYVAILALSGHHNMNRQLWRYEHQTLLIKLRSAIVDGVKTATDQSVQDAAEAEALHTMLAYPQ